MTENKKYIIANWKMNPPILEEAKKLYSKVSKMASDAKVVVCPPSIYLEELSQLDGVSLGAQNFHWEEAGAFTGEISVSMLKQFNVKYVLVGHSERRALGETDDIINKKILSALAHDINSVLFVGEKEKGEFRQDILVDQLARTLVGVTMEDLGNLQVVYEPVWAISSQSGGESDTPENALEAIGTIRTILTKMFQENSGAVPILYGGSVNPENVAGFLSHPEISGAVVGAASLNSEKFERIIEQALGA